MGLKLRIKKLEDVAEGLRAMYKAEGEEFVLDVDGVVAKEKLDEFRNNNIALQRQLDALKDVDPAKYRELIKVQEDIEAGKLIAAGKVDEAVELRTKNMKTELEGRATTAEKALETANGQLAALMIDAAARSAAAKLGVKGTALDDVVLRARAIYRMKDGVPTPIDSKGQTIFGKDGSSPMPIDEWAVKLKSKEAPHLFEGSSGSGAGGGNRSPGGKDPSQMSPQELITAGLSELGGGRTMMPNLPAEQT
jgi:hypothetical protein